MTRGKSKDFAQVQQTFWQGGAPEDVITAEDLGLVSRMHEYIERPTIKPAELVDQTFVLEYLEQIDNQFNPDQDNFFCAIRTVEGDELVVYIAGIVACKTLRKILESQLTSRVQLTMRQRESANGNYYYFFE